MEKFSYLFENPEFVEHLVDLIASILTYIWLFFSSNKSSDKSTCLKQKFLPNVLFLKRNGDSSASEGDHYGKEEVIKVDENKEQEKQEKQEQEKQ